MDDFSRKTWIYFLSEKSGALDMFKKFKALVEKESGCFTSCLRTGRVENSSLLNLIVSTMKMTLIDSLQHLIPLNKME